MKWWGHSSTVSTLDSERAQIHSLGQRSCFRQQLAAAELPHLQMAPFHISI